MSLRSKRYRWADLHDEFMTTERGSAAEAHLDGLLDLVSEQIRKADARQERRRSLLFKSRGIALAFGLGLWHLLKFVGVPLPDGPERFVNLAEASALFWLGYGDFFIFARDHKADG